MGLILAKAEIKNENEVATLQGLEGIFENIINSLLFVAAILLFLMLLAGGFKFITSRGDPKALESARNTITYALVGIILVAMGYLILVFLSEFTGNRGILNFKIYI